MTQDRLLKVPDVAARLGISEATVRDWLRRGKLKGIQMGRTKAGWRVRESDLERFIEAGAPQNEE